MGTMAGLGSGFKPASRTTINNRTSMTAVEWTPVDSVYRELMNASSKGAYYSQNIRGKYR
jgi:hypothetical protein